MLENTIYVFAMVCTLLFVAHLEKDKEKGVQFYNLLLSFAVIIFFTFLQWLFNWVVI